MAREKRTSYSVTHFYGALGQTNILLEYDLSVRASEMMWIAAESRGIGEAFCGGMAIIQS